MVSTIKSNTFETCNNFKSVYFIPSDDEGKNQFVYWHDENKKYIKLNTYKRENHDKPLEK